MRVSSDKFSPAIKRKRINSLSQNVIRLNDLGFRCVFTEDFALEKAHSQPLNPDGFAGEVERSQRRLESAVKPFLVGP